MRLSQHTLLRALAICGVSATLVLAALPPPYNFTGQWRGTATSRGVTAPLSIDFMPTTNPRKFTGSVTLGPPANSTCSLTAKYRKRLKLHLKCADGSKPTIAAQLDTTTQTLTGSFLIGHRHPHQATFTLMPCKQSGASCVHDTECCSGLCGAAVGCI
jgi:hypothetical protein